MIITTRDGENIQCDSIRFEGGSIHVIKNGKQIRDLLPGSIKEAGVSISTRSLRQQNRKLRETIKQIRELVDEKK